MLKSKRKLNNVKNSNVGAFDTCLAINFRCSIKYRRAHPFSLLGVDDSDFGIVLFKKVSNKNCKKITPLESYGYELHFGFYKPIS